MLLEWTAVALIIWTIKPHAISYLNINWEFLKKHSLSLILLFLLLLIAAYLAPSYLYPSELPEEGIILRSIGPVSSIERVAFVFLSLTAGICEEIIFRGYGISVLERISKRKDVALILSSAAFMSLHGIGFLPWPLLLQYFIIGLIFGYFFQKYRRLEWLILIHFALDALIAISVP